MLKTITFFAFLLTGFIGLNSCNSKEGKQIEKPELELTAQLGGIIYLDTTPTIHISTTLFNPTDDTISFVTMTCSYEDMFLTDTTTFKIQSRYDCYSNVPAVFEIPPNSKLDQFIMVRPITKEIKVGDNKIRIGMYYLIPKKENGHEGVIKQYENRQNAKIIWSNQLTLNRLYRNVYQ